MEVDTIRITHYINPHMFWYKPVSAYVHNLEEKRFQLAIDEYCEEHFRQSTAERHYDAFPGETVAVLDFERNKWCRCVVDDVVEDNSGEKQYNLWAIDDGVPLQSSSRYVNPLPKKFSSEDTSKVKRGAIKNILPSECIYDYNADRIVPKIMLRWDAGASSVLQTIIKNSTIVYFRNVTKHKVHNIPINMGELELLTRKNNIFRAGEVLKEMRRATEVEPRDFITRLLEIQTMSVDRFRGGESSDSTKRNQEKPQIISPNKSFSRYDRNGYMRMPNGVADDSGVRELELNGVKEEDFDESASMVKPNHAPERARPYQPFVGTIEEIPQSEEEVYPISSSRVKAGVNADFERQLWKQTIRPPCIDTFAQLKITDPDEVVERNVPKNISNRNYPPMANTRYEENDDSNTLEKPKTTVSFLSKLEMRKKMRAAQKTASSGTVEQKPSSALINIVPAGFDMGNVSFDNGKIVAGDSSDSSERKAKHTSPSFKPRTSFEQQVRQRLTPPTNGERSTAVVDKQHHDADSGVQNSKVYMSKHTSRFDQLIEDEAW